MLFYRTNVIVRPYDNLLYLLGNVKIFYTEALLVVFPFYQIAKDKEIIS